MKQKKFSNVIGLMSGTSADGIDTSIVNTDGVSLSSKNQNYIFPYSKNTKEKLRIIMNNIDYIWKNKGFIKDLELSITYDHINAVNFIKEKYKITPSLIGFHGQTILHEIKNKVSVQLGNGHLLSKKTNCNVVFDFRSKDINNGGQGAPLAPIYHKFILNRLFGKTSSCLINIGGVSNLSYFNKDIILGYDTGPGCGLMDEYMKKNLNKEFDDDGKIASLGKPNNKIINKFLQNPYFFRNPPKSIDKFQFGEILNCKDFLKLNIFDGMSTLCNFTAETIIMALQTLDTFPKTILFSGGGRNNSFLLNLIKKKTSLNIHKVDDYNINGDFVESELMAYLAARFMNQLPSTYPSTTGTQSPTICGRVAKPN